ncbi:hypothetical protein CK203_035182 [Vitis vinifera]|uniref:Uncharacterized protein n=1 Tax=Vitis vinifera TaxID=29760 RepID=A0A438HAI3_VITVI|nr:hypothetical protein CK203_035182 [Vitis vinifera]
MPAKASARLLSARLIFSIVHSVNCCKIRSLETDRARARSNPDKMASYSASLLEAENPSRMACSKCSPVGDCSRSPTPEPDEREAPSTRRVHHSCLLDSWCWLGLREYSSTKSAITWPFMDNLGWNSIPNSLIQWPIVAFSRLNLACAECCEGAGQLVRSLDELGNKGGASGQRFEGLRLLAPFLNIWFLRLPMPC